MRNNADVTNNGSTLSSVTAYWRKSNFIKTHCDS